MWQTGWTVGKQSSAEKQRESAEAQQAAERQESNRAVGLEAGTAAGRQAFGAEPGQQAAERQAKMGGPQALTEAGRKFYRQRMREIYRAGRRAFQRHWQHWLNPEKCLRNPQNLQILPKFGKGDFSAFSDRCLSSVFSDRRLFPGL